MKTQMNFRKTIFTAFTMATMFFVTPCFAAQRGPEMPNKQRMLALYRANKAEVEKWVGAMGATSSWGFFMAKGRPWGRNFLAGFLCASSIIAAGRFVPVDPQFPYSK